METTEVIKQLEELGFVEIHNVERAVESPFIYYQGKEFHFYRESDGLWKFHYAEDMEGFFVWSKNRWSLIPPEHSTSISDMMVMYI